MVDSIIDRISKAIANEMDCGTIREHELPEVARAILQAIREPSDAMLNAGYDADSEGGHFNGKEVWRAMIDAAMEEK